MNPFVFLPLAGVVLWLGAIYIDSKFSYQSPTECGIRLKETTPWWKKLLVDHNYKIRYGALFSIWVILSLDVYMFRGLGRSDLHYLALAGVALSIAVYIVGQAWRFFVKDSDKA